MIGLIKFRKTVIAVMVCNRLRKKLDNQLEMKTIKSLGAGLELLKQSFTRFVSSTDAEQLVQNDHINRHLLKIFSPKDFYNRNLFMLEA
jgi:hypothetical protein